jgi:hypothetical protein
MISGRNAHAFLVPYCTASGYVCWNSAKLLKNRGLWPVRAFAGGLSEARERPSKRDRKAVL